MVERLPRDVVATWIDGADLKCPWCRSDAVCDATIKLEDLLHTISQDEGLKWAEREPDGTAGPSTLQADCPDCSRPFMIAVQDDQLRLLAVRTRKDAKLMVRLGRA